MILWIDIYRFGPPISFFVLSFLSSLESGFCASWPSASVGSLLSRRLRAVSCLITSSQSQAIWLRLLPRSSSWLCLSRGSMKRWDEVCIHGNILNHIAIDETPGEVLSAEHLIFLLPSPPGCVLGPDWRPADGSVSDAAWVLVRYWQLYFPLHLPIPGVWHPLPPLCNHTLLLYVSAGAGGQLLHPAHRGSTCKWLTVLTDTLIH